MVDFTFSKITCHLIFYALYSSSIVQWDIKFSDEEFCQCKKFADSSSETQRDHRSGGTFIRNVGQISADTLRGKLGETAVKNFLISPLFW